MRWQSKSIHEANKIRSDCVVAKKSVDHIDDFPGDILIQRICHMFPRRASVDLDDEWSVSYTHLTLPTTPYV